MQLSVTADETLIGTLQKLIEAVQANTEALEGGKKAKCTKKEEPVVVSAKEEQPKAVEVEQPKAVEEKPPVVDSADDLAQARVDMVSALNKVARTFDRNRSYEILMKVGGWQGLADVPEEKAKYLEVIQACNAVLALQPGE